MKIAFIPSTFLPTIGGSETQIHNMANKFTELGNFVDVLLLKKEKIQHLRPKNGKMKCLNGLRRGEVYLA